MTETIVCKPIKTFNVGDTVFYGRYLQGHVVKIITYPNDNIHYEIKLSAGTIWQPAETLMTPEEHRKYSVEYDEEKHRTNIELAVNMLENVIHSVGEAALKDAFYQLYPPAAPLH